MIGVSRPIDTLKVPCRSREAAALDKAESALRQARPVIVAATSEQHSAVAEIDRALADIAELRR